MADEIPPETQTDQAQLGKAPGYVLPFRDGKVRLSLINGRIIKKAVELCKSFVVSSWAETRKAYPEKEQAAAWERIETGLATGKYEWGSAGINSFLSGPAGVTVLLQELLREGGNPIDDKNELEAFLLENAGIIKETINLIVRESDFPKL